MKKILLLLTVTLLVSCEYIPEQFRFNEITKKVATTFSKNTIDFKNNTIVLTSGYEKMEPEQFKSMLDSVKDQPRFVKVALQQLKKIEDKKVDFELFVDEKNVENYVFIYACDFYQFDEHRAAKVVQALNNELMKESYSQKVKYRRIHGRFFFTPTSKVVKLKYLNHYKKERKFQTEYIVSSKSGGIGLLVSNTDDIDFENSIKKLAAR